MKPINEFLILKEMTATDLRNLDEQDENAFWDEYQKWRQSNIDDVVEQLQSLKNSEVPA